MSGCSSGITRISTSQGDVSASSRKPTTAGPLLSSYSPLLARSETVTTPIRTNSPGPLSPPPPLPIEESPVGSD